MAASKPKAGATSANDCSLGTVSAMQIDFHPEATAELDTTMDWYAVRSVSAARNFIVAVDLAITAIVSEPQRFVHIDDRHQSCAVTKFPFQIVFRRHNDRIIVVAVAHAKRRPGYWRDR